MTSHVTSLRFHETVAWGTMAFHFAKPQGFAFKPGQAIDLILPGEDMRHAFSLVSAPFEDELVIATRMRDSAFKKALGSLAVGAAAALEGPFGSLTLHKKADRAAVLVAGGIGITPFMSMLRDAAHARAARDLRLIYSNRRPEDAAFLAELQTMQKQNPRFKLACTMTDMNKSKETWAGATGMIDSGFVKQATNTCASPIFYLAGPPGMVDAMRTTIAEAGIEEDDIRSEEFYGY